VIENKDRLMGGPGRVVTDTVEEGTDIPEAVMDDNVTE
jgi:hypothetical protein